MGSELLAWLCYLLLNSLILICAIFLNAHVSTRSYEFFRQFSLRLILLIIAIAAGVNVLTLFRYGHQVLRSHDFSSELLFYAGFAALMLRGAVYSSLFDVPGTFDHPRPHIVHSIGIDANGQKKTA